MKKPIFILLLTACFASSAQSQDNLDSLLNTLHNRDVYVAPIIRGVSITYRPLKKDSVRIRRDYIVSSLDTDIQMLAEKYPKKILITKLYALLSDPERDFYANALLYDLLENVKLAKLMFMTREQWIANERWSSDIKHWKSYMERKVYVY